MRKPNTHYTKSGRINIAYQVFGSGDMDLVYIPGWVSNIDLMWNCPELVTFLEKLGENARVMLFDKRGTGLSDRVSALSSLEERMDDIRAVMDAVASEKAVLFGHSEGGSVSALFAATYPNRTIALITFGVFAKRKYAPNYPWAPTEAERQKVYDMIENSWGGGDMNLADLAPSKANDEVFMDWLANYFRSGASPSTALALTRMNTEVDIIPILSAIKVPTLMMQRINDIDVKIEEGRFIAAQIKGAKFIEFDGNDHLFWTGNTAEVLNEMIIFLQSLKPSSFKQRQLLSIVIAKIFPNTSNHPNNSLVSINSEQVNLQLIQKYRGTLHYLEGNTCIATFEGPSRAIHCSIDLQNMAKSVNMHLRIGIHVGECLIIEDKIMETPAISLTKRIQSQAQTNQILVAQSIKNLLPTEGLKFTKVSIPQPTNLPPLFTVEDRYSGQQGLPFYNNITVQKNGFLLENVLQCIDENLNNEQFSVEMLCREVGLGERQLQRKLKAITNKSPNQIIRSVRLHRAKELLLKRSATIAQVAFQTGFANPAYFSKVFKKEFGIRPSEL